MLRFIGLDPGGSSGGAAMVDEDGKYLDSMKFDGKTDDDIAEVLKDWLDTEDKVYCCIEKVHSMPKQGVSSSFKFGCNYGLLRGIVTALDVPREYVSPQTWQKVMSCRTKGDKNVSKAKAQELMAGTEGLKITHAIADALLLALYARKVR